MTRQLQISTTGSRPTRIAEFDGIRAFAIIMIMTCHVSYGLQPNSPVGQYLGGTFNFVFFIMSALLAGLSAKPAVAEGARKYMGRRLLRIVPDLWLFLTAYLIVALACGMQMPPKSVAMNFAMLGWFAKLPHIGHLWFVTMIMMCYAMFFLLNRFRHSSIAKIIFTVVCVTGQVALEKIGMPGYMFLILLVCGFVYLYAQRVVAYMSDCQQYIYIYIIALAVNGLFLWMLYRNVVSIGHLPYYYISCVCGILAIVSLFAAFRNVKIGKIVLLISALSYQLYLVHHPLCNLSIYKPVVEKPYLAVILVYVLSFVLAWLLKSSTDSIVKLTRK